MTTPAGRPMRPTRIDYTRVEPGWQVATVYGLAERAVRFHLVRSMDGPGWKVEVALVAFGVRQESAEEAAELLDGVTDVVGPHPTLRDAKAALWTAPWPNGVASVVPTCYTHGVSSAHPQGDAR